MQAARLATRLQREMRMLQTDPPPGVCAWPCNDKLTHLEAQVEGPEETVYSKGIFKIEIHVPERYPFEPPNVKFKTPVYHPNIDSGGRICLDILNMPPKGSWKPSLNIPTILASIGLLLAEPNPDDGLMGEITAEYKYNREAFNSEARKWTDRYALHNQSKDGMPMNRSSTLSNCDDQGAVIGKINASSPPEPGAPYRSSSKKGAEDLSYSLRGDSNIIAGKMQPSAEFPKQGSLSNQKLNLSMKLSLAKGGKTLEKETCEQKPTPDFPTSSDKYASREHTTRPEDSARSRMNWVPDSLEPGPLPRQDTHSAASTSASTSTIAGETVRGIAAKTGVLEKATLVSQVNSAIKTSGSLKSAPQGSSAATARPSVDLSKLKRPKEASLRVQPEESLKERRSASQVSLTDCTYDRTGKVGAPGKTCNDGEDEGRVSLGNSSVLLKPHSSQPHNGTAQPQAEILNNGARKRPRDAMDSSTLSVLEGLADTTSALTRGVSQEGEKPSKSMKGPNAQAVSRQPSEDPTSIQKQGLLQKGAGSQNLSQSYRANGSEVTNPTNPVEDKTSAASRETENVLVVTSEGVVMHEHISPRIRHPAGAVLENASSTSQTKVSAPLNENRKLSGHASAKPSGENPGGSSKTNGGPEPALRVQKDVHMIANPDRGAALRAASINKTGALDGADQTPTSVVKPLGDSNRGQNMKPPPAGAAIKLAKSSRNIDTTALIVLDSESDEELAPRARSRLSLANRKGKKRK